MHWGKSGNHRKVIGVRSTRGVKVISLRYIPTWNPRVKEDVVNPVTHQVTSPRPLYRMGMGTIPGWGFLVRIQPKGANFSNTPAFFRGIKIPSNDNRPARCQTIDPMMQLGDLPGIVAAEETQMDRYGENAPTGSLNINA